MKIRDLRSISIIGAYLLLNGTIIMVGLREVAPSLIESKNAAPLTPESTQVQGLEYFNLRDGSPLLSLKAEEMTSLGEESAEFTAPHGIYYYKNQKSSLKYRGLQAFYHKKDGALKLLGDVELIDDQGIYRGQDLTYFFEKDLVMGVDGIRFNGTDVKTGDDFDITSQKVQAHPKQATSLFTGNVSGNITPKKKYQAPLKFDAEYFKLDKFASRADLWGGVRLNRGPYLISGRKAELFFQNYNKSLKYFVINDDVKVTETLNTPQGVVQRRSFSESLEGFGSEKKMILSGAPRVEQGKDVIKGYRITIRENAELIEVDDAMSDVQVKRKKN